jgi:hypothetical protein
MTEKMNESASFYVILAFLSIEFEAFCVFLRSGLTHKVQRNATTADGLSEQVINSAPE